jgi:hypothetical protein
MTVCSQDIGDSWSCGGSWGVGLEPGDGLGAGAGVEAEFFAVVQDPEVGVLDEVPACMLPTRSRWRVTMMRPSRATRRWTLIGPTGGGGSGVVAMRARAARRVALR